MSYARAWLTDGSYKDWESDGVSVDTDGIVSGLPDLPSWSVIEIRQEIPSFGESAPIPDGWRDITDEIIGTRPVVTAPTLISNEKQKYAEPWDDQVRRDRVWEVTSGSLYVLPDGGLWTGVPDVGETGYDSSIHNNSSVFRINTRRLDLANVRFEVDLVHNAWASTVPLVEDWHGTHLFMRHVSEETLYYVSVARRDGAVVIKRKCAGGPAQSNGGTYTTLKQGPKKATSLGETMRIVATIEDITHNGVPAARISVDVDGEVVSVVDDGSARYNGADVWGDTILEPGSIGIRHDYVDATVHIRSVHVR